MLVYLFTFIRKLFCFVLHLPSFILHELLDVINYIKNKQWKVFEKWGIHLYLGRFGGCKTSNMVADAYSLAKQYKDLTILTNLKLTNFPDHTKILQLNTINDILEAPEPCLVLIDEIGTIFNSRDFKAGNSLPKILFQHLCQCRHRHLMLYGTVQDWEDVDIQIRRKVATVRKCSAMFGHPFTRWMSYTMYDGKQYDRYIQNVNFPITPIGYRGRIQSNKVRKLYDTKEMVNTLLKMEYDSDEEILANQGIITSDISTPLDSKQRRQLKRNFKRA